MPNIPDFQYNVRASNRVTDAADPKAQQDTEARDKQLEDHLSKIQKKVNAGGGGGGGGNTWKFVVGQGNLDIAGNPLAPGNAFVDLSSLGLYDPDGIYNPATGEFVFANTSTVVAYAQISFQLLPLPTVVGDSANLSIMGIGASSQCVLIPGITDTMLNPMGFYQFDTTATGPAATCGLFIQNQTSLTVSNASIIIMYQPGFTF